MALLRLQTHNLRNLAPDELVFSPQVNLVYGENGSGKTSVLEAVAYLGLGRSFRVNRHEAVARHGCDAFTVFGEVGQTKLIAADAKGTEFERHRIGLSRNIATRETRLKMDGEAVRNLSQIARHLPVSIIDSGTFDVVAGGPAKRRQFLDWAVFHVEHGFSTLWQQCQRATSQRNKILRNGRIDKQLLRTWDRQYVALAEQLTDARYAVFAAFKPLLMGLFEELELPWAHHLRVDFSPGWDQKQTLADALLRHFDQEHKVGHTLVGPNRADIRIRLNGRPVAETLSRGQQKTLVILMKVAQGRLLREHNRQCTFLLDDINAELDQYHRTMLAQKLRELDSQVFITSIEPPHPQTLWQAPLPDCHVFHVEHGRFTPE